MKLRFSLIIWFTSVTLQAQDYPRQDIDLSRLADDLFSFQDLDLNYEDLYENMVQIISNPINLNKANGEELRFLNILSELQIQNFIQYRKDNGNLVSMYELQAVDGFDLQTIYRLMPFVRITNQLSTIDQALLKRISSPGNSYFITRYERTLETKRGFSSNASPEGKFKGQDGRLYARFRSSKAGDYSYGFTVEKDAGEQIRWSPTKHFYGFDYISMHAQIQNKGIIKNLIVGDFQNQFAQGLVYGGVFGLGKGGETISTIRRSNIGSIPYTSVNEAGYLSGVTTTLEVSKHLYVTGLYSHTHRDGNTNSDSLGFSSISAFQTTGFHRSDNELKARKTINEKNYGAVIQYKTNTLDAGLIYNTISFSSPITKTPTVYNQFAFHGKQNSNIGAFLNYTFNNFTFFSEVSNSTKGGKGAIVGLIGSVATNVDIAMLYRKYDKNFYTFYSNAFAENTNPQNETGIYWGIKYRYTKRITASGYMDLFQFPWLKFRSYTPSTGYEWLARLSYQPSKTTQLYLQIRQESKVRNLSSDANLYLTGIGTKRNYWINCDYTPAPKLKIKTRAQFSTYQLDNATTSGMAILQDVSIDFGKLKLVGRYALFDTDDYDNRQYVYEQDVLLAYSLPAYYGVGIRNFILVEYKISKTLNFWFRFARTHYTDRNEIGSSSDLIVGNTRNDLKFQFQLKF